MDIIEKDIKNMEYVKIYGANIFAFIIANVAISTKAEIIDTILKILVAVPTIIYTCVKIASVIKNELKDNTKNKK